MDIPGFEIRELVARGGSSSVFRAVQHSLDRQVALKILKPIYREVDAARFFDEGRIIAALNHSNIITIYDIGAIKSWYYIAMEFLDGGSLRERIGGEMPMDDALGLVESIGASLDFVHRQGVVHRDIKPANILFHADGTPKLTDFGIAKQLSADQELTLDGRALGSPYYLSPEQAQCRSLDGRSDIYSLGVVLYEMLTGHRPYVGESHIDTILAHLTQPVPMLPDHLSSAQGLLNRMMAKDPGDRFDTAAAMVEEVRQLRRSVLEGPPSTFGEIVADRWMSLSSQVPYSPRQLLMASGAVMVAAAGAFGMFNIVQSDLQVRNANLAASDTAADVSRAPAPAGPAGRMPESLSSATETARTRETTTELSLEPLITEIASQDGRLATEDSSSSLEREALPDQSEGQVIANTDRGADTSAAAIPDQLDIDPVGPSAVNTETSVATEDFAFSAAGNEAGEAMPLINSDGDLNESADFVNVPQDSDEIVTEEQLQAWLDLADEAFAAYRLTIPREDNAYYFYRKVLSVDSGNTDAKRGIQRVAGAYAGLASREISRQNLPKARAHVDRGLRIRPGHRKLTQLNAQLADLEASQRLASEDPVKRFFKRVGDFLSGGPGGGDGAGAAQRETR